MAAITDDHDERALIEAARADPARFVDLYERHFHRVYAYVVRRTGSRAGWVTLQLHERDRVREIERSAARASQRLETRACADPFAHGVRKRADVEPGRARQRQLDISSFDAQSLQVADADADWGQILYFNIPSRSPLSRHRMASDAADLLR